MTYLHLPIIAGRSKKENLRKNAGAACMEANPLLFGEVTAGREARIEIKVLTNTTQAILVTVTMQLSQHPSDGFNGFEQISS